MLHLPPCGCKKEWENIFVLTERLNSSRNYIILDTEEEKNQERARTVKRLVRSGGLQLDYEKNKKKDKNSNEPPKWIFYQRHIYRRIDSPADLTPVKFFLKVFFVKERTVSRIVNEQHCRKLLK